MRHRSPLAFAGVLIILLLAVMGFAAFSTQPVETTQTAGGVVLPPTASGRIAGSVIGAQLATSVTPVPTEAPDATPAPQQVESQQQVAPQSNETTTTPAPPTSAAPTTTTTAPTTTTSAPTTTTPPTTTTAPPTTTTTTTPPTTTTTPPTTTTAPPEAAPIDHPPEVEQWRSLVAAYWPAELVDEALSVIDCESNGDPDAVNSSSGASGLFQFLPSTWESASPQAGWDGADVFDPEANVATAYWLYSQFEEPWQQWNCKP